MLKFNKWLNIVNDVIDKVRIESYAQIQLFNLIPGFWKKICSSTAAVRILYQCKDLSHWL